MGTRGNLCIGIVLLAWAGVVAGDTHYVASGQSIQAVIDDPTVVNGDVVEVAPGTYTGPGGFPDTTPALVDFKGKAIRLRSSGGATATTIDGTGYYHVVQCVSGEGTGTILEGFTITGGDARGHSVPPDPTTDWGGGGMYNKDSSPTVANCIFQRNSAGWYGGGGMCNEGGSPTVSDCTFNNNSAHTFGNGGGMHSFGGSVTVTGCTFSGNSTDGSGGGISGGSVVTNCTFSGNGAEYAGGIDSAGTVTNCTFSGNGALMGGGGIGGAGAVVNCTFLNHNSVFGGAAIDGAGTVTNCIVWWDRSPANLRQISASTVVTYSDVKGGFEGAGNIDADPLFVGSEDFHLASGSPCIDAGTNSPPGGLPATDLEGNPRPLDGNGDGAAVADMGAYEAPQVNLAQLIQDLLQDVLDLNLEPQVRTSLTAPLQAALRLAGDGNAKNNAGVAGVLNGFIKTVTAYRGKKIAEPDADALLAAARSIVNLLSRP